MQSGTVTRGLLLLSGVTGAIGSFPSFVTSSFFAAFDPEDTASNAIVGELTAAGALQHMLQLMMADASGRALLKTRPLVTDETLKVASSQPEGTFGHRYATYMNSNKFRPSGRSPVTCIRDPTLAYVMLRYRQSHDFLHACVGCGRTVEEELAIKLFEWHHTGLPIGILSVFGGMPWLNVKQILSMKVYNDWAFLNAPCQVHGKRYIPCMLNVPWESYLDKPYEKLIADFGITPLDVFMREREHKRHRNSWYVQL
ncbi:putative Coenzyme Q (ubiquinone) biosynthesis protein Coq4 [Trypanosoma vivax]|uniref:Ubiquinone biosynthesis protein COQ4 homolog, mitochondrial n=1 Tax=Trypanosoma vivax (strain Y486) TaxID=1055687 RepID=G0U8N2_TRYVY|nr:putative ubiquinone biosynthesis protein-like protein [Trypanosoma vivax]KAH8604926.1 putative Coenzyme Q (ubiquinone) biosynthesis protein Coq4 [Trypanosoma vivax]CCC53959.1 putative ubiquinone biosynthesis protein-like protein [Trypanosoma vivax Y486]